MKIIKQTSHGRGWPQTIFTADSKTIERLARLLVKRGARVEEIAFAIGNDWNLYLEVSEPERLGIQDVFDKGV